MTALARWPPEWNRKDGAGQARGVAFGAGNNRSFARRNFRRASLENRKKKSLKKMPNEANKCFGCNKTFQNEAILYARCERAGELVDVAAKHALRMIGQAKCQSCRSARPMMAAI
jgi:hypothetical protein